MAERRCPICKGPVKERRENPSFPFCSQRCRLVDLGRWFAGDYRVAPGFVEDEDESIPTAEEDEE